MIGKVLNKRVAPAVEKTAKPWPIAADQVFAVTSRRW